MADTSITGESQILYLEPDDEIPSVVRRVRESELPRLVLVAPGRSKATSSAIGLRLLARHANEVGRQLSLVADPAARALAAEAGIPAFASIDQAKADAGGSEAASAAPPAQRPLAAIHVVRGEAASPPAMPVVSGLPVDAEVAAGAVPGLGRSRIEDTQAVPVAPPVGRAGTPSPRAGPVRRRAAARVSRTGIAAIAVAVLALAALIAAVLPSATIRIVPKVSAIGPLTYTVTLPAIAQSDSFSSSMTGKASGTYDESTPARGPVVFANYSSNDVLVPKGTRVSAGDRVFTTDTDVTVPSADRNGNVGIAAVNVTASAPGPNGNVQKDAIDTIDDSDVA